MPETKAFENTFSANRKNRLGEIKLENNSRVAVIGGGPAGSFFSYFALDMAGRLDLDLQVDIYESRDFTQCGPAGCNMCGGIVSESLVQHLAAEGINLPQAVVERGIDSYVLHMQEGSVRIDTPLQERRIAAVHRGAGPRGMKEVKWTSFDAHLLGLAQVKGANLVPSRVLDIDRVDGRFQVRTKAGACPPYDLIVVAVGINSATLKVFHKIVPGYHIPDSTKTYIGEFLLGEKVISQSLGSSMHVFLLDMPRLEFAALVPKGEYVTACVLGRDIDSGLVNSFLNSREVKNCMPPGWVLPVDYCHCLPRINIHGSAQPFYDRMVFIGDSGVTRLYKDGIGAAYRTAKAAAVTATLHGISAGDFKRHYAPICRSIEFDNAIGKFIFFITRTQQSISLTRRAILHMVQREQHGTEIPRRMSSVMWDLFTGSASYADIFRRTLHPAFLGRLFWEFIIALVGKRPAEHQDGG
jgi:flavin-dependent dehydrogenase